MCYNEVMSNPERWVRFNPLPANIHARIEHLIAWFQQSDVQLAYLFGSLTTSKRGQDVDLALLTETVPVYRYRTDLYDMLNTQRLDLIDLAKASPPLRFEVVRTGRLLYAVSDEVENAFESATLQIYHDMVPRRRQQEEQLRENLAAWSSNEV